MKPAADMIRSLFRLFKARRKADKRRLQGLEKELSLARRQLAMTKIKVARTSITARGE